MVLTELVRLFDSSTKSTIVYVFIVLLTDHRHLIVQYIFLYFWDIAATAESTSGRRFCALFEYVLHYSIILKEMRGREIFDLPG